MMVERAITRPITHLPTFVAEVDCEPHDINILPHMHSVKDVDKLFPTITAAPEPNNMGDFDAGGGDGGRLGKGGLGRQHPPLGRMHRKQTTFEDARALACGTRSSILEYQK